LISARFTLARSPPRRARGSDSTIRVSKAGPFPPHASRVGPWATAITVHPPPTHAPGIPRAQSQLTVFSCRPTRSLPSRATRHRADTSRQPNQRIQAAQQSNWLHTGVGYRRKCSGLLRPSTRLKPHSHVHIMPASRPRLPCASSFLVPQHGQNIELSRTDDNLSRPTGAGGSIRGSIFQLDQVPPTLRPFNSLR
jgi:hypothetical protein